MVIENVVLGARRPPLLRLRQREARRLHELEHRLRPLPPLSLRPAPSHDRSRQRQQVPFAAERACAAVARAHMHHHAAGGLACIAAASRPWRDPRRQELEGASTKHMMCHWLRQKIVLAATPRPFFGFSVGWHATVAAHARRRYLPKLIYGAHRRRYAVALRGDTSSS